MFYFLPFDEPNQLLTFLTFALLLHGNHGLMNFQVFAISAIVVIITFMLVLFYVSEVVFYVTCK